MSVPDSWKIFASRTSAIERRFTPKIQAAILKAYSSFLADLKTYGIERATSNLNQLALNDDLIPVLTGIYSAAGVLGAQMTSNELKRAAKQKAANIGRNQSWINAVLQYLRLNMLFFVAKISETTREDILKMLEKGIDEGMGAEAIARIIEEKMPIVSLARARVISRSECVSAANYGHAVAASSFRYEVNKQWVSAKDIRTRHSHMVVNGQVIGEHETFKVGIYEKKQLVGWDEMKHPGDVNAHPSNRINCRCRVTYIPRRLADGRLIPRQRNVPVMTTYNPVRSMNVT